MGSHKKPKPPKSEEQKLSRQEQDKIICYRYAQCLNASTVAREFGVSRMYVSRAWARLPKEEQEALRDTSGEVSEELNQKILDAERIAGDNFVRKVVQAREIAADELLRRFKQANIKLISDKDFTSLLRLVANISTPAAVDDDPATAPNTFRQHREAIRDDIENPKNNNEYEQA